jgi:hypothetical protein
VRQYRYRTAVLTGPWRDSHASAMADAVRAKQAVAEGEDTEHARWLVPGRIEERVTDERPTRARN